MPSQRRTRDPSYIARGSVEHATFLGLVKDEEGNWDIGDKVPWLMLDPTGKIMQLILESKIRELEAPLPKLQSKDPRQPNYAPLLWEPNDAVPMRV